MCEEKRQEPHYWILWIVKNIKVQSREELPFQNTVLTTSKYKLHLIFLLYPFQYDERVKDFP